MLARRFLRLLSQAIFIILITAVLLEGSLRLFPRLIPPFLLADFNPVAREQVAERLGYPTDKTVRLLPREDGGPPRRMRVFRPRARVTLDVLDPGFVKTVRMDVEGFCNPAPAAEAVAQSRGGGVGPGDGTAAGPAPRTAAGKSLADIGGSEERAGAVAADKTLPASGAGRNSRAALAGVVALGDSFTWGVGVRPEQAWPARLQELLGEATVNLGSPGIGLYEYLEIFRQFGAPRSPRVVVLNIYEGNDLRDAEHFHAYRRYVGSGAQATTRRILKDRPLAHYSYAYNLVVVGARAVHHGTRRLLGRWLGIPTGEEPAPEFQYTLRFREGDLAFNPANVDQDEVLSARALRRGELDLALLHEGLVNFVELARRHGFHPVVAYTPSAYTAYAEVVSFRDAELADLMPWFSSQQRQYLARAGAELGYAFVDLTPAFQEAARRLEGQDLLYFPTVLHLTARGHAVAASALAQSLRRAPGDDRMSPGKQDSGIPPAARMGHP